MSLPQPRLESPSPNVFPEIVGETDMVETTLGRIRIAAVAAGICRLEFFGGVVPDGSGDRAVGSGEGKEGSTVGGLLEQAVRELTEYFGGRRKVFTVPLAPSGTAFQLRVWRELTAIPHGERRSYRQLAEGVGLARGQRAVGAANGRNPIPILIPCHRVVAVDDGIGGYSGGVWRKCWLLDLEASLRPKSGN